MQTDIAPRQTGPPVVPTALRIPMIVIASACAATLVALAVLYAGSTAPDGADRWARSTVLDLLPLDVGTAFRIDIVGDPRVVGVLMLVLTGICLWLGRRRLALVAVAGPVLTGVVTTVLKPVTGRTIHEGFLAYPSGHTAAVTALALVSALLVVEFLRAGTPAKMVFVVSVTSAAGGVMAWSQITLDAHYSTDTVGGFCAAFAVVTLVAVAVDRSARPRSTSP